MASSEGEDVDQADQADAADEDGDDAADEDGAEVEVDWWDIDPPRRERRTTWALIAATAFGLVVIPLSCAGLVAAFVAGEIDRVEGIDDAVTLASCAVTDDRSVEVELFLENRWQRSIDVVVEVVVEAGEDLLARATTDPYLVLPGEQRTVTLTIDGESDHPIPSDATCRVAEAREICATTCGPLTETDETDQVGDLSSARS